MRARTASVCWDRTTTEVIGVFWPAKSLHWMRRQLTYFHNVLVAYVRGFETADLDPTAAALGVLYRRNRPDYPPLRIAFDQHFGADMPALAQRWWEPDVVAWWHAAAVVMRDSIPDQGSVVVLNERQATAWKIVLPPYTVMYSVLRGVWPLPPETTERERRNLGPDYLPEAGYADRARAEWLARTWSGLCTVSAA